MEIQRTNFTNIEWVTLPIIGSGGKYVFNEKHGLIYLIKNGNVTLIAKTLPNVFVVGTHYFLPGLPELPYVKSAGSYLYVDRFVINIATHEITDCGVCGEYGDGLSLENYKDVPRCFDIYNGKEVVAKCYLHTAQFLEVENMEKNFDMNFDFNICDVMVNGKFLYVNFDCKANDFETEKFACMAALNWRTGEIEYYTAATDYILNMGDYIFITAGEDFNPGCRKVIDVPNIFYILASDCDLSGLTL